MWANTGAPADRRLLEYTPAGAQIASVPLARAYGDIAFNYNGTVLYGVTFDTGILSGPPILYTIDPLTGAETASVAISGAITTTLPHQSLLNGLTAQPDGTLLVGSYAVSQIFSLDPTTGVSSAFASFPAGVVSSGDFLALPDGDVLAFGFPTLGQPPTPSPVFRIHPDNTLTQIGTVPTAFGAALSGGTVYTFDPDGTIYQLTSVPTAASTAPLAVTVTASTGNDFFGATSVQDAGNCVVPAYTVAKTASTAGPVQSGDTVTYTVTVTNTGGIDATGVFTDDLSGVLDDASVVPGSITASAGSASITGTTLTWSGPLAAPPAAGSTATVTYQVKVNDPAGGDLKLTNLVTPTAPGGTCTTAATCTTTVPVTANSPTITKKAAETSFVAGQTIHYTYTVTNTTGVPLTNIAVTDNGPGTPAVTCPPGPLAPGASVDCTATYTATAADATAGTIVDTAALTASALGQTVTATSNTVTVPLRALTLTKSAIEANFQAPGETIHYTYTVTNTGRIPLGNVTVTDLTPGVTVSGCGTNQLAPGQSTTCQATYVTTAADVANKNVPDQGQVTGTDPGGQNVTTTSNQVNTPLVALSIVKKATEKQFTAAGQTIHYTYTVTNTGAQALTNLALTDNGPGRPTVTCPVTSLAPGASTTCTATYTTTAADVRTGKVTDTAKATATTPDGRTVTKTSNTVTVPFAGLAVTKAVQETAFSAAGQKLHYTFTVTNTGNTTLANVAVTDNGPGSPTVTCPVTSLAPGASTTCTATYTTTAADVKAGKVTDTAKATATTPDGTKVTGTSNTLTIVACTPCEDKDHGGCDGHNPDGHEPPDHGDHGGHHPAPEQPAPDSPALTATGIPTAQAGLGAGSLLTLGGLLLGLRRRMNPRHN
ncbi:DUF7507 domain-containing protein [Kitasatospora purpeofusca]|uniref:DUF7507 domain-containing protein n=1 Tax=Kitasatospora purpeofusca TaxID=67352 RepID=UPI003824338C